METIAALLYHTHVHHTNTTHCTSHSDTTPDLLHGTASTTTTTLRHPLVLLDRPATTTTATSGVLEWVHSTVQLLYDELRGAVDGYGRLE